jgi:hypothetical protein
MKQNIWGRRRPLPRKLREKMRIGLLEQCPAGKNSTRKLPTTVPCKTMERKKNLGQGGDL